METKFHMRLHGPALAALMFTVSDSDGDGEGLLLGTVTSTVIREINDNDAERKYTQLRVLITGHLPLPGGLPIAAGTADIDRRRLLYLLGDEGLEGVVGWFKHRRSATLQMSLRDHMIQASLERLLRAEIKCPVTSCLVFSAWQRDAGAAHTFNYAAFYGQPHADGEDVSAANRVKQSHLSVVNIGQSKRRPYRTAAGDNIVGAPPKLEDPSSPHDSGAPQQGWTVDAVSAQSLCATTIDEIEALAKKVAQSDEAIVALRAGRLKEVMSMEDALARPPKVEGNLIDL